MKIPAPAASDRETVVTALETAAAFDAKGNAAEALHWVKRAVQFAGEAGDDVRALALAHVASALTTAAQSVAPSAARGSGPAQAASTDGNASARARKLPPPLPATRVSERPGAAASLAPKSPSRPPAPSSRPARPSRPAPSPPKPSLAMPPPLTPSPSMTPSLASAAVSRTPPAAPGPAASLRPSLPTVAQAAPRISQVPNVSSALGSAAASAPSPTAAELELQSAQVAAGEKSSVRTIQRSPAAPLLRQTARVSVVASPNERGLFLVRMLAEGESPPAQAAEALLVVLDPKATVLSR